MLLKLILTAILMMIVHCNQWLKLHKYLIWLSSTLAIPNLFILLLLLVKIDNVEADSRKIDDIQAFLVVAPRAQSLLVKTYL